MAPNEKNADNVVAANADDANEKDKFLNNGEQSAKVQIQSSEPEVETSQSRKCCKCTRRTCLIITGVIGGLIFLILLMGFLRWYIKYSGSASQASPDDILAQLGEASDYNSLSGM